MTIFPQFGRLVSRSSWFWLVAWAALAAGLSAMAPPWDSVTQSGEFAFLPDDAPTRRGERAFEKAFPEGVLGSSIAVISRRSDGQPLTKADQDFVHSTLTPQLEEQLRPNSGTPEDSADPQNQNSDRGTTEPSADEPDNHPRGTSAESILVADIRSPQDEDIGRLLKSDDGTAWLVIIELRTEFLDARNRPVVNEVEDIVGRLQQQQKIPQGLQIELTGSAVVGRDVGQAKSESADATKFWTITLVVVLLIVVYRAPLLAALPLTTLSIGFTVALKTLAIAAAADWIGLFRGIDVYTMVVVYGAGIDYSLFLTSRVHEELRRGADSRTAVSTAIEKVGAAIAASAGTEIFGIAMLSFASFGKLHQAGITISFGLAVMLLASLTLTPSVLRLTCPWIFWPGTGRASGDPSKSSETELRRATNEAAPVSTSSHLRRGKEDEKSSSDTHLQLFDALWNRIGSLITNRPGLIFAIVLLLMAIPAGVGVLRYNQLSYGLITQLPDSAPSVSGTRTLQKYFPAGQTGPVTVLINSTGTDFSKPSGIVEVKEFSKRLAQRNTDLQIADIRSVAQPLGREDEEDDSDQRALLGLARRVQKRRAAVDQYVSDRAAAGTSVTRMEVILSTDPFARTSIEVLSRLEAALKKELPESLSEATVHTIGPTASMRDLKDVAADDRVLINVLVTAAVFVVLLCLLRRFVISMYLLSSVIFSYLVALGITFVVFERHGGNSFDGLDWTVPLFLFTILIAVGVDYNIFLISRVDEERKEHGPIHGVREALTRTGAVISSCGIIMAGTFSSLAFGGELSRMTQLGVALATGILLDTFLVRPVLLPCFLILTARFRQRSDGPEN